MTDNREIIEMLKILKEQSLKSHNDTAVLEVKNDSFNFVIEEAIKALEQQPCEDCISRQAVFETLRKHCWHGTVAPWVIDEIGLSIKALPPVTPKKKTGKWMQADDMPNWYWCSECGCYRDEEHDEGLFKYCPTCGAKMEE